MTLSFRFLETSNLVNWGEGHKNMEFGGRGYRCRFGCHLKVADNGSHS